MLNVEVKSAEVITKDGVGKNTGKPYSIREQELWIDLGKAYPVAIIHSLGDNAAAFPVGRYVLGKDAFVVTRFGQLGVDTRKLRAAVAVASKVA